MKFQIEQLYRIARKKKRNIIGLMSGTSLDGLDVAWCSFSGSGTDTRVQVQGFETLPYEESFKQEIRRVFAQKTIDFQQLTLLNVTVAEHHARLIQHCLKKWGVAPNEIDLVASHGQTVFHAPKSWHHLENYPNATLQIGDGDHLAVRLGIIVVSDFRQKHLAYGGEGAPLALYGDYFLFSKKGEARLLLNLGGIANFTYLPADLDPAQAMATDTGPGNTLLDYAAQRFFGVPCDRDSLLARAGRVDERLLDLLKNDAFFDRDFPKTTGPELFGADYLQNCLRQLPKGHANPYDIMATLSRFTADTIADAVLRFCAHRGDIPAKIFVSGGGAHNPAVMQHLQHRLSQMKFLPMSKLGISGDAKEAVLFATLANETVAGGTKTAAAKHHPVILGGLPLLTMGKISLP